MRKKKGKGGRKCLTALTAMILTGACTPQQNAAMQSPQWMGMSQQLMQMGQPQYYQPATTRCTGVQNGAFYNVNCF